jgi:hypothetical protein
MFPLRYHGCIGFGFYFSDTTKSKTEPEVNFEKQYMDKSCQNRKEEVSWQLFGFECFGRWDWGAEGRNRLLLLKWEIIGVAKQAFGSAIRIIFCQSKYIY